MRSLYPLVRTVHGVTGLTLCLFVVMYFFTGLLIVMPPLMPASEDVETTRTVVIADAGGAEGDALAEIVRRAVGTDARLESAQTSPGGRRTFVFSRPGRDVRVSLAEDGRTAEVVDLDRGLAGRITGLHRIHGYGGGLRYALWGMVSDLAGLAMIGFTASGIYLWYTQTKDRRLGWAILAASWGLATYAIAYLMLKR